MQCLRATYASSLAHQIANSSVHRFYTTRSSWQMQFWILSIGSEVVHPPEKLSNDHAHDPQTRCSANKTSQFFEHVLQPWTIGQLESFSDVLVKRFAQAPALQSAIASASAVLQSADEMEMAELHDPALALAESDNSGDLVGDRGPDTAVYPSRNCRDRLRPAAKVLPARQEHRVEKEGSIVMARLYGHLIQDPIFSSKAEIKSIQDQNQGSSAQAQRPRSRRELSQGSTKTPTQALRGKAVAWRESLQWASVQQNCFQNSRTRTLRLAAAPLLADCPRTVALTALTTSRTEVINFRSATGGVRVPRMHARELDIDYGSKYSETQVNPV